MLEALWTGPQSVWMRASQVALAHFRTSRASAIAAISPSEVEFLPGSLRLHNTDPLATLKLDLHSLQAAVEVQKLAEESTPSTAGAARERLLRFVAVLRRSSASSAALADCVFLLAKTQLFFTPAKYEIVRADLAGGHISGRQHSLGGRIAGISCAIRLRLRGH